MNSFLDNLSQFFQREHLVSPTMNHSMAVRAHNSHIGPGIDFVFCPKVLTGCRWGPLLSRHKDRWSRRTGS